LSQGKASTAFFEKKAAKKLLTASRGFGAAKARAKRIKSFLVLFFKKELLCFHP
jgi:hypothetical protein